MLRVCLCLCSLVFMAALGTPSCPSLAIVPSISNQQQLPPACQALNNCSGLSCFNAQRDRFVVFVVENCKDPVNVNVTITDGNNATVLMRSFNKSIILSMNESYRFNWTMRRNASHLLVKATVFDSGIFYTLIPRTVVSLNASDCMCQSIQSVAELSESPVETNCTNNSKCTGLECTFNLYNSDYKVETEVNPCTSPPGIVFLVRQVQLDLIIFQHFFNSSQNSTLFIYPLRVIVIDRNYSMIVSIDLVVDQVYHLVPRSQIILDKTNCTTERSPLISPPTQSTTATSSIKPTSTVLVTPRVSPTGVPTTSSIKPTSTVLVTPRVSPTGVLSNPKTCEALKQLASNYSSCSANLACDGIECNIVGYKIQFQILPCRNPPGIHVTVYNFNNVLVYDEVITNTTQIGLSPRFGVVIIVHETKGFNSIGLEIKLRTPFATNDIVRYTEIPIERCNCTNVVCSTNSGQSSTLAIEISVPVVFLVIGVLLCIAVALVVIIVIVRKRKVTSDQFQFKQMSSINDDPLVNDYEVTT